MRDVFQDNSPASPLLRLAESQHPPPPRQHDRQQVSRENILHLVFQHAGGLQQLLQTIQDGAFQGTERHEAWREDLCAGDRSWSRSQL